MKLTPLAGMDTRSEATEMMRGGDAPQCFVRDAINGHFTTQGHWKMRCGVRRVADTQITDLWQSPLDGSALARQGQSLVRVNTQDWTVTVLSECGAQALSYLALNDAVLVAGGREIVRYRAGVVEPLALPTPAAPWLTATDGGLTAGQYAVAVAWLGADQRESGLSAAAFMDLPEGGGIQVALPPAPPHVIGWRLYATPQDSGQFYQIQQGSADSAIIGSWQPGKDAPFRFCQPMPSGRFIQQWGGRIVVARGNLLLFSQPLAFHVHDPRHDYVALPEAVTFIAPVENGLWVGQRTCVLFLRGMAPEQLQTADRCASAPVPGSAVLLKAGDVGGEIGGTAQPVAAWLAEKGYVLGMADGAMVEVSAGILDGVHGERGHTVAHQKRLLTVVI